MFYRFMLKKTFSIQLNINKENNYCIFFKKYICTSFFTSTTKLCQHNPYVRNVNYYNKNQGHLCNQHRKCCSKGLLDGYVSNYIHKKVSESKKLSSLFPQPRVTLNELNSKTPDKIFDVYYKQNLSTKVIKKSKIVQNDWTCTYSFIWPEKKKFESMAMSKKKAADEAATQAIYWLYTVGRIDSKGLPIYDKNILAGIRNNLNDVISVSISDNSIERLSRITEDFNNGIKDIFLDTHNDAMKRSDVLEVIPKDSTIDEDEESSDLENSKTDSFGEQFEFNRSIHPVYGKHLIPPSEETLERRTRNFKKILEYHNKNSIPLHIDNYMEQIASAINCNTAVVIVGTAGCGKSTRAPLAALREHGVNAHIIVSEPRRIAAIGLAQSVASEFGEEVGQTVGYHVRLHSKPPRPPGGSLLYCTSGVLLRRLLSNPGLGGCSHVFIDEAHERDVNTDVTLLLLKRAMILNRNLKVIIMSATLDVDVFTKYFNKCPVVEVPGRTFPVAVSYLDDTCQRYKIDLKNTLELSSNVYSKPHVYCNEVAQVIKAVDSTEPEGAILVFLPGWTNIKMMKEILDNQYGQSGTHLVLPVHSRLSTSEQSKMFSRPLPGVRKIVLSTNIAETSITIPDVVYVIDCGAHKENRLIEGTGTASLETVWISQAAAKQRAGRAGRVQPGHCFRLYTREKEATFVTHTTPEILRIPLEHTALECKTYAPGDKVEDFLSQLPEPPSLKSINIAVNDLVDLGAISMPGQKLTPLGRFLSAFTVHPRLSCALIHAVVLSNIVSVANIITHLATNVDVFEKAVERKEEIRNIKRGFSQNSDHAAFHWIQDEFEQILNISSWNEVEEFCQKYGIKKEKLKHIRDISNLHLGQLLKSGIVEKNPEVEKLNRFSDLEELSIAALLSGANSLLVTKKNLKTKGKLMTINSVLTSSGDRAHISIESVNYGVNKTKSGKSHILAYFGGYHSTDRRALVVRQSSMVTPHMVLIFCKGDIIKTTEENEDTVLKLPRHNLDIIVPSSQADLLLSARDMLWRTFQYYVERDTNNLDLETNIEVFRFKTRLVKAIARILIEAQEEHFTEKTDLNIDGFNL